MGRERRKVAREGWGLRLLARQDPDGRWAGGKSSEGGLYSPKWISTTYTMLLLRDFGLPATNRQAHKACRLLLDGGLQRDGGINCGTWASWTGTSETWITGMVLSLLSYFEYDDRLDTLADHLLGQQTPDGGWNCQRPNGATHPLALANNLVSLFTNSNLTTRWNEPVSRLSTSCVILDPRRQSARRRAAAESRQGGAMSEVRVLVGTAKGAFVLTADGKRMKWEISGPHFGGLEIYHLKGSPVDPNRIYASQGTDWFGQVMHRSDDGGKTWETVGNEFKYDGETGTHQWYDGTPHPWEFKRVWHLEPSLTDPDTVLAGAEDAAMFRSSDGGKTWQELPGLRGHTTGSKWAPGAGGLCLHTILVDRNRPGRMYIAISSAGAFRTDDDGTSWRPINRGLKSEYIPDPEAEIGHCVHRIAMHPSRPDVLFMQKHWDVMRSDDAGESWHEISGNLPSDFGFVIDVHAHEPETAYVIPIKSDSQHFPPEGKLRVYRSRTGGNEWEALTKGLPQRDCYVNVLREAMAVDSLDPCGVYFGTTGGQVYASANAGDSWEPIVRDLPRVMSVEVQTLP